MGSIKYTTYYTPICKDDKGYFQVNGATKTDRDDAIREAKKHTAFKNSNAEIIRVDEVKEVDYDT